MADETKNDKVVFGSKFDDTETPTEITSLCMCCYKEGLTRLLFINIPFFREVVVMAFECPHCHFRNNEVQSSGAIQELGSVQTLVVTTPEDLNRQVIKTEHASFKIIELDFEIPPRTQKGMLSTIEGILRRVSEGLSQDQPQRFQVDPDTALKVHEIIVKINEMADGESLPFSIRLDDCSGNSFIENPSAPKKDANLKTEYYHRSKRMNVDLGLASEEDEDETEEEQNEKREEDSKEERIMLSDEAAAEFLRIAENKRLASEHPDGPEGEEIMCMPCPCTSCGFQGQIRTHIIDIPHFKEVVIMAFSCPRCGFRSNEVKAGGGMADHGTKLTLKVENVDDLSRDILKSDTAGLYIPDLDLEVVAGSLGGRFTTVEGILTQVRDQLSSRSFGYGDSSTDGERATYKRFLDDFANLISGETPFTLIVDDPVGNSYIQNLFAPDPDPQLTIETYTRSFEQNEDLGLNDMNTENYMDEKEKTAPSSSSSSSSSS